MKSGLNKGILLALVCLIVCILVISVSCWGSPTFELIVENQTEYDLTIYVNDYKVGSVGPGEQITNSGTFVIDTGKFHIVSKNDKGQTVFSKTFSFNQMQEIESRVYKVTIK